VSGGLAGTVAPKKNPMDWAIQAVGQQHTSPFRARCEARRREVAVICGCGSGLRDAPVDWTGQIEQLQDWTWHDWTGLLRQ